MAITSKSSLGRDPAAEPRAANGSRTRDLELGKLALYQLSYRRAVAPMLRNRLYRYVSREPSGHQTPPARGARVARGRRAARRADLRRDGPVRQPHARSAGGQPALPRRAGADSGPAAAGTRRQGFARGLSRQGDRAQFLGLVV